MSKLFRSVDATEQGAAGDVALASPTAGGGGVEATMAEISMAHSRQHNVKTDLGGGDGAAMARSRPMTLADLAEEEARRLHRESLEGSAALKFAIRLLIAIIVLAGGTTAVLLLRR